MIKRPLYMEKLKKYRDVPVVKILAGIRRCGKSTLLNMYRDELIASGVSEDHIINVRYTSETVRLLDHAAMYDDLKKHFTDNERYYLLLDEVQEIDEWEKAINSLLEDCNVDIYVTGSNSRLMSGEISTYLTGRYVLIPVYTLSFAEYLEYRVQSKYGDLEKDILNDYIRKGGFPLVAYMDFDEQTAYQIVEGIYTSVVANDITRRHSISNFDLFSRVVRYIIENVGKTFSANSIIRFLKSEGIPLTTSTIYNYLDWLEKAFVIYRCRRYNIQGKSVLKTQEKYFLADQSLKYCLLGFDPRSIASMIENIVYLELLRRDYKVYIGKTEDREIDFIAIKRDERIYIQVCRNLPEDSDRELGNLLEIKDNYPKYIVTLDRFSAGIIDGVHIVYLEDFLLMDRY